jgi:hypothetical protein
VPHLGGGQQVGRALGAQPVGQGHAAVAQRGLARGGELVDDGVGPVAVDRPQQAVAVGGVGDHRGDPEGLEAAAAGRVAGQAEDLVAVGEELAGDGDPDDAGTSSSTPVTNNSGPHPSYGEGTFRFVVDRRLPALSRRNVPF